MQTMLRLPEVLKRRARGRAAHYGDIAQGLFTPAVKLGARASGWPESEVETLNNARVAGYDEPQIRALVAQLLAARKVAAPPAPPTAAPVRRRVARAAA